MQVFHYQEENIFQNTGFKEKFFLPVFVTVTKQKMVKNGDVNNRIAEQYLQTKHRIDWDCATCVTQSTDYYQRLTLESWFTNLEQNATEARSTVTSTVQLTIYWRHQAELTSRERPDNSQFD